MRLGASLFLRAGAPGGWKLETRRESLRRRGGTAGVGGFGWGRALKLKAGRDRDRNGRGRLRIFFIYARADTKTSKVSDGKGRSLRLLSGRRSTSDIMRIAEHSISYADLSTVLTL